MQAHFFLLYVLWDKEPILVIVRMSWKCDHIGTGQRSNTALVASQIVRFKRVEELTLPLFPTMFINQGVKAFHFSMEVYFSKSSVIFCFVLFRLTLRNVIAFFVLRFSTIRASSVASVGT